MSQNAYSAGGKFQPSQGNAKWSQVTSLANSNLGVWGRPQSDQGRGQKREGRGEAKGMKWVASFGNSKAKTQTQNISQAAYVQRSIL